MESKENWLSVIFLETTTKTSFHYMIVFRSFWNLVTFQWCLEVISSSVFSAVFIFSSTKKFFMLYDLLFSFLVSSILSQWSWILDSQFSILVSFKETVLYKQYQCSLIIQVSVVLRRTVVGSGDWHFYNLCGSHHQSQVKDCCRLNVLSLVCVHWLVSFAVMLLAVRLKWCRSVVIGWFGSVNEVRLFCLVCL